MIPEKYLTPKQKELYNGSWVDNLECADKDVMCVRCFNVYHLKTAPRTTNSSPGYYTKEPQCPKCACKLYYSN